jgi:hypothetical protein
MDILAGQKVIRFANAAAIAHSKGFIPRGPNDLQGP